MLSVERLRELFTLDAESGVLYRKVRTSNRIRVGDVVGSPTSNGYLAVCVDGKRFLVHRVVFAIHYGRWPLGVDHVNGNRTDNRPKNLREANHSQNALNAAAHCDSSSGVKGVSWFAQTRKWQAKSSIGGRQKHIGFFDDIKDAESAVKAFREKHHGEFSRHG